MRSAAPLAPADRDAFLRALAAALHDEPELGDGTVAKAIRHVIRPFFRAPAMTSEPRLARRHVGPALPDAGATRPFQPL